MKRILTLSLACALTLPMLAKNENQDAARPQQNYTPLSKLQADEYMPNTLIFNVLPQYRNLCSEEYISLPALNDYFTMIGAVNLKKKFPLHKAPTEKYNKYGAPMIDLSLIYEVHYTSAMELEMAIGKMFKLGFFQYVEPHFIPKAEFVPNDPNATSGQAYHLYKIVAAGSGTTGWDISTGNASTVVAICDTGTELTHSDLTNMIAYNTADPINGTDDDNDGYIDNYRGWDVGMNDNDPTWQANAHGVHVSGCASAQVNNSTLVAGSGYNCKFLPVKISDASGALNASYDGITYAADHGCRIINCSWGGSGGGSFGQQVIDYATNNQDALVVAAAGNNALDEAFYPAAYDKVLSVCATDNADARAGFTNYNYTVDVAAPGNNIRATWTGNSQTLNSGTSMASPVCAGVCAIVASYFPTYNALQVGERVKRTTDNIYSISPNNSVIYTDRLGTGRINLYKALTDANSPSVIYENIAYTDNNDLTFVANDTVRISGNFKNYLAATTNLGATLSVVSGGTYVTLLDATTTPGAIATLASINNNGDPFQVKILPSAPVNQQIVFKLTMTDGPYTANQYFSIIVNVDYINITINDVWTTITSKGLIGYNGAAQVQGLGFNYLQAGSLMYESSFMVGKSATAVSDMTRGNPSQDNDFSSTYTVREVTQNTVSDFDLDGKFSDAVSPAPLPVSVHHKAFAWSTAPHRKYVIVQYTISNTSASSLSSVYAGIFSDWDIDAATYGMNKADFDAANKMGYVWYTGSGGKYCGIKLLTNTAPVVHYAIDNISGGNGGINIFDGYATNEKYTSLSTNRAQAGGTGSGFDVCDVVSSGPFTIGAGDSVKVAFALIAGDDLADLQASAVDAQTMYDNLPLNSIENTDVNASMLQLFPNPSYGQTEIRYTIPATSKVQLTMLDATGRLVRSIAEGEKQPGEYTERIDVSDLPEGMYFLQLISDGKVSTRKMMVSHQ
jgi:serine protease